MFKHCYVITMKHRSDRMKRFWDGLPDDWPFVKPEVWRATKGALTGAPPWWKAGLPAWGCYQSHMRIFEEVLNLEEGPVFIMEDDVCFRPDFTERALKYIDALPGDWEQAYFGGQHLHQKKHLPRRVNNEVLAPHNVNRTHAYAVTLEGAKKLYQHLLDWDDWRSLKPSNHIDHRMGVLHERKGIKVYCPTSFMCGQDEGKSDIMGRKMNVRYWNGHLPKLGLPAEPDVPGQPEKKKSAPVQKHSFGKCPVNPQTKPILLVCNGPSAMRIGPDTSDYWKVVRINNWVALPEVGGNRCDLWMTFRNKKTIKERSPEEYSAQILLDPQCPRARRDIGYEGKRGWPSTGALAIHALGAMYGDHHPIVIAGMDHWSTGDRNTHYWGRGFKDQAHDTEVERAWINSLDNVYRLS